jgi:hypothetical protein
LRLTAWYSAQGRYRSLSGYGAACAKVRHT